MMKSNIKNWVSIKVGQSFPGRLKSKPDHDYLVLDSRAVDGKGGVDQTKLVGCYSSDMLPKKWVHKDDVLLSAKSSRHRAIQFTERDLSVVATSYFLILTINQEGLLAEYLTWYLNHPATQERLQYLAAGAVIKNLSKTQLLSLEISVPPLVVQLDILKLADEVAREQALLLTLAEKKQILWNDRLQKLAEG
ncbi:MAG: restriction endonuclease subunit S [Spongiibacteraceae bacterium]|nr:restriction endonuclease subunit S [Spongiibacteraceae bacterium]